MTTMTFSGHTYHIYDDNAGQYDSELERHMRAVDTYRASVRNGNDTGCLSLPDLGISIHEVV